MTRVVLGAGGMLGRALLAELPDARAFTRAALDVTDAAAVSRALVAGVAVVYNAAADTKVDRAETDLAHRRVNAEAVGALARRCAEIGALLVHVSTDYVFGGRGTRPYRESDATEPVNAYGRGKLDGERLALASGARVLVVRTSWLFGAGPNFVDTMLGMAERGVREFSVVADQVGRPTYAPDLAAALVALAGRGAEGVVHFANAGEASWFDLAREAFRVAGHPGVVVRPCATAQFPRPARRPAYSVLDTALHESHVGRPRPWKAALADYVAARDAHVRAKLQAAAS